MTSAKQQTKPNHRYAICDGCAKGFRTPAAKFYSGEDQICAECEQKQARLKLLREQLKSVARYGHVEGGDCAMCAIQNQIDDLVTGGYDWREEYERHVPTR